MRQRVIIACLISLCVAGIVFLFFLAKKSDNPAENTQENEPSGILGETQEKIAEKVEAVEDFFRKDEEDTSPDSESEKYFLHENITVTLFWVGEKAGDDNNDISNSPSAWDEKWKKHFGGTDSPKRRNGFYPADFVPKENPFYAALPYNDFGKNGKRKQEVAKIIPWAKEKKYSEDESMCKNRWLKIAKGTKAAYAQWEDVGPFNEDDEDYVFGSASPKSKTNKNAGLDVSPAIRDYLDLKDIDKVDWQFVDEKDVPDGPWKKIITVSQIDWN